MHRAPATIVVLAWNEWKATRACLDALRTTLRPHDEVIVVDNGSTDQTPRGLKLYPWLKRVTNLENRGFAAGCNQGAALATNDIVVFLNNDTLPVGRWLDALLDPFADDTVGATGSRSNFVSGPQLVTDVDYATPKPSEIRRFERDWNRKHRGQVTDVERLVGFCLAIRRGAFDALGGFDEGFGLGGYEDDDICTRLRKAGHRLLIAHGSFVHHDGHKTFDANGLDWLSIQQENQVRYSAKHATSPVLAPGSRAPFLSACMIVRDEEDFLGACLASIVDVVDEIVVYDTGSTDRTIDIARNAGATVIEGYWDDDFARARNAALAACAGTWVLQIDADEELIVTGDLRAELSEADAFIVPIDNVGAAGNTVDSHGAVRIFQRSRAEWTGRLHERLVNRTGQVVQRTGACSSARLRHWGYANDIFVGRGKADRNVRVALAEVADGPSRDGRAVLNLARSLVAAKRTDEAIERFEEALRLPLGDVDRRLAFRTAISYLIQERRFSEALAWIDRFRAVAKDDSFVTWLHGLALVGVGDVMGGADLLAEIESVQDGDGYTVPRATFLRQRAEANVGAGRWTAAFEDLLSVVVQDADAAPWAMLTVVCSQAGADPARVAALVDENQLLTVLGEVLAGPPEPADALLEALWGSYAGNATLLACAGQLAPRLGVERALEWSSRLRAVGLEAQCPLIALAKDASRDALDRVQAAGVVAAAFDPVAGDQLLLAVAPAVEEESFVSVLVALSDLAPHTLPGFVAALTTTSRRCLDLGRVLHGLGAADEAFAIFGSGLELLGVTEADVAGLAADVLEACLAERVEAQCDLVPDAVDPPPTLARALLANRLQLDRLEAHVERLVSQGDDERAARFAQAAAHFAWSTHTGRFASHRLERAMETVGRRRIGSQAGSSAPADGTSGRILHVLTEAHAVGGHTRLAWRWMTYDIDHEHELVLTRQGNSPVPKELVEACDGRVHVLDQDDAELLPRAADLRQLAATADTVVLHTHPFDVVPLLALAPRPAPVVLLNHAGHVFWLGGSVGDVVANLRASTYALAASRRGLDPQRLALLPSPLDEVAPTGDGRQAKIGLGLDPQATVLLTIASPYKYAQTGEVSFLDLVLPVLDAHPEAVLVAVGPGHDGAWADAARRTGGRVRAFGYRQDLRPFHEAADVYLDSHPLPSTTSLLEAASLGTPVVSFAPGGAAAGPLCVDDPMLGDLLQTAKTVPEHTAMVSALLSDDRRRAEMGQLGAAAIAEGHTGPGWRRRVNEVYEQVRRMPPARPVAIDVPAQSVPELDEALLSLHTLGGQTFTVERLLQAHGAVADAETWQP